MGALQMASTLGMLPPPATVSLVCTLVSAAFIWALPALHLVRLFAVPQAGGPGYTGGFAQPNPYGTYAQPSFAYQPYGYGQPQFPEGYGYAQNVYTSYGTQGFVAAAPAGAYGGPGAVPGAGVYAGSYGGYSQPLQSSGPTGGYTAPQGFTAGVTAPTIGPIYGGPGAVPSGTGMQAYSGPVPVSGYGPGVPAAVAGAAPVSSVPVSAAGSNSQPYGMSSVAPPQYVSGPQDQAAA
ncbi:hypothetical protein CBR_g34561 [Chara braunii]|uniref:Uncharacterized protein n=1 Tax=Chara braunii TaxID=69332 RepID=A0A388LJ30_CHABU|nr:hypothetical protein CBR_g34561 [Chara braunii]|eukprot:GBG82277.1 hypothetical protein CBR_g34561 [Chara braunii]